MENALLIGLSRQIALQRELDVVANNIANLNTTGFKADGAVFEEFLMPGARARRSSRAATAPELRAGPRDLARFQPGRRSSRPAIRSTSRSTATPSSWCRRRAANATPATARCRSTPPASSSPATATACSATAGRSSSRPPTATSRSTPTARSRCARAATPPSDSARGKLRLVALRPRRSSCRRTARACSRAPDGVDAAAGRRPACASCRARSRSRTCARVVEMARMIEVTRAYTQVAGMLQQHERHAPQRDREARRSSGVSDRRRHLMRALHTAATGMMAQELNVQVISNNIANMRTTGYKRQRAEFQDLLYEHVRRVGTQTSTRATSCRSASSSAAASRPSARRA